MSIYLPKSKARIIADDYTALPLQLRISYELFIGRHIFSKIKMFGFQKMTTLTNDIDFRFSYRL